MIPKNHQYGLEKYRGMSSRHHCPGCQQRDKTFILYVDTLTGQPIHETVGRCNRESSCGYHYTPKEYFITNNIGFDVNSNNSFYKPAAFVPRAEPSIIPQKVFTGSLNNYGSNHFVSFLNNHFGVAYADRLIADYFIGTSQYKRGGTVFWQISYDRQIRTGKIIVYNPITGKRSKTEADQTTWVHAATKQADFNLQQCLFGEHLLRNNQKPIAIVESEKTAIIASAYLPQFVWLATSGINGLNADKCQVLNKCGHRIYLFPDVSRNTKTGETAFTKWMQIANKHLNNFYVSDLLELNATVHEWVQGLDIADYLVKYDLNQFVLPAINLPSKIKDSLLTVPEQAIITVEKKEISIQHYTLQQLQSIAGKHFEKYFISKNKAAAKEKYYSLWADGMATILNDAGITKSKFLNS